MEDFPATVLPVSADPIIDDGSPCGCEGSSSSLVAATHPLELCFASLLRGGSVFIIGFASHASLLSLSIGHFYFGKNRTFLFGLDNRG